MRRMLVAGVATLLFAVARAGEPSRTGPDNAASGQPPAAEKKAEADPARPQGARGEQRPPPRKPDAKPAPPKPCEPVRPCPID